MFTLWVAFTTLYERKLLASIQQRVGPLEVGYKGRLQYIADSLKLLAKGIILLFFWSKLELILFSIFSVFFVYIFWINIVLGFNNLIIDLEYNIIFIIIISCIFAYSIVNIGMLSKNKFAFIACLRFTLTILNAELLMGFLWTFLIIISESVAFNIFSFISYKNIIFLAFIPVISILLINFCMEVGRTPTDFGESESELIAGYITELSGFLFTLFYLCEYFHLLTFSNNYSIIFFNFLI